LPDGQSFPAPTNNEHGSLQHGGPHDGWVRVRLNERDDNTPDAHGGDRDRSPITVQEIRGAIQRVTGIEVATPFASPDSTCLKTALHTWFGPPRHRADDGV
jgi:hypothetical protein